MSLPELASTLGAPMYALPVDIFRVFAGFVGLEYFRRAFVQTPDFSSPDGLIDHEMSQRLFPPTRLSLFQPGVPIGVLRSVFLLACFASILVIFGYQTKPPQWCSSSWPSPPFGGTSWWFTSTTPSSI